MSAIQHNRFNIDGIHANALRLSKAFNTTPELCLNLQRNYNLREAAHKSNDGKLVEAVAV